MRKILWILCMVGIICACTPAVQQPLHSYQTFIVWYDSKVGKTPLLQRVQTEKAEIIYDYQNFNAMALRIPVKASAENTRQIWENIPGVLSIQPDQVMHLD